MAIRFEVGNTYKYHGPYMVLSWTVVSRTAKMVTFSNSSILFNKTITRKVKIVKNIHGEEVEHVTIFPTKKPDYEMSAGAIIKA